MNWPAFNAQKKNQLIKRLRSQIYVQETIAYRQKSIFKLWKVGALWWGSHDSLRQNSMNRRETRGHQQLPKLPTVPLLFC
ncbi:hypothetical protein HanXRQr2_Chr11g0478911 [Helianthus annuus]|uniref:Uncharacterized protein n=1 Tax=Helianthus annuus TaxID=4232 RepID=A0A9K3HMN3_HELAN|nr:hypothetical protein HanXRQr2_Chr11g0478911 [Helianthus annuus]